jgi:outer membrane receptor for ferrienterochelin and colicins
MMRYKISLIFVLAFINFKICAQQTSDTLFGKVQTTLNEDDNISKKLTGVHLQWLGTQIGTISNPLGEFKIPVVGNNNLLIVSYKGFKTDTLEIMDFKNFIEINMSKQSKALANIVIVGDRKSTEINYLSSIQTLKIKQGELLKAACCNLSESFETTPSVDVSFTDAITGQKQIQMLGLATPYTLITQENIPNIRGLASITGLNFTPGTWVQGMQLSKGTGSVVNGYESLAGQINVELQKPDGNEKINFNAYQNSGGRSELNLITNKKWNATTAGSLMLHYKNQWAKQDNNADGFMDNPLGQQFIGLYRMQYFSKNGFELQGMLKQIYTNDNGGQLQNSGWHYYNKINRTEANLKIGKVYKAKPWKSMGLQLAGFLHNQNLQTPRNNYTGKQNNFYANYIYQNVIGNTNHSYKIGASFIADDYNETMPDTIIKQLLRTEIVPGIFAEHTYNYLDQLTIVSGFRVDYHNLYGAFITPRLHIRYVPWGTSALRFSVGKARRTVSILAENQAAYFTNRKFIFNGNTSDWQQGLQPEVAWNIGTSFTQPFTLNYRKGTVMIDYYYSWFTKQIIADYETPRQVSFYNLNGKSFAHSLHIQSDYEIIRKKLDVRLAYKYYNVKSTYNNILLDRPLIAQQRAFINLAYATQTKWKFDATYFINSAKRLPNSNAIATDVLFALQKSNIFSTINMHISKQIKKDLELYAGVENLSNYMQPNAIISAANPSSNDFDASETWGPVMGINGYVGVRWRK